MTRSTSGLLAAAALAACCVTGCHGGPAAERRSSFEVLDPASEPHPHRDAVGVPAPSDTVEVLTPVEIPANAIRPVCPPESGSSLPGVRTITVTVSFDANGSVTDVGPSLRGLLFSDARADAMLSAVKTAVLQWHLGPPRLIRYRQLKSGQRIFLSSEPLAGAIDLRFNFGGDGT